MATRVIPEQKITTCDVCGIETDKKNRSLGGRLVLKRDALDFQGQAVADASVMRDLCDSCLKEISDVVNKKTQAIRSGNRLVCYEWGD